MTKTADTPKMNVAVYARVSTDKQDNTNQLEQLREFADRQGWVITVEFVDSVTGSGRKTRPQFERMLLAASQREFELLLFWALDRLSREGIVRTLGYLEQLRGWNIGWRSYTQPFLDTGNAMTNGIVLSVLSAVAQQERVTISERTKAGLQRAKRAGRTLGRRALEVDLARVERHRADGLGLRAIAAKLGISVNTLQRHGALRMNPLQNSGSNGIRLRTWMYCGRLGRDVNRSPTLRQLNTPVGLLSASISAPCRAG